MNAGYSKIVAVILDEAVAGVDQGKGGPADPHKAYDQQGERADCSVMCLVRITPTDLPLNVDGKHVYSCTSRIQMAHYTVYLTSYEPALA